MAPSPRLVLLAAGLVPLAALTLLDPDALGRVWAAAAAVLALLAGMDALGAFVRGRALSAVASAPPFTLRGEAAPVRVELAGPPGTAVELRLEADPRLPPPPTGRASLSADGRAVAELPVDGGRRGRYPLPRLWLRWTGPLGLVRRVRSQALTLDLVVVPNVRRVREAALAFFGSRDLRQGATVERTLGQGSEFHALREWSQGMDPRSISWRASARHRRLLGLEQRAERSHRVVLAFDTGRLMTEPLAGATRLDHAAEAGLLLAWAGLKAGDQVGLFAFDERPHAWVRPAPRLSSYEPLRDAVGRLPYTQAETNFTLGLLDLAGRLERRSLVVVFTDFVDVIAAELMLEALARLSRHHLALFVTLADTDLERLALARPGTLGDLTRAGVAADLLRERRVVLRRLERLGVHVVEAAPGTISARLLDRYLDVKRRELIG